MRRVSTYHAFFPAQLAQDRREGLKVCTGATATRIDVEGNVAVGVVLEPTDENKVQTFYARARKQVVVCCGALGSPQLLLLRSVFNLRISYRISKFKIQPVVLALRRISKNLG
jgi:choline dehydrogenase-like flavoprotein